MKTIAARATVAAVRPRMTKQEERAAGEHFAAFFLEEFNDADYTADRDKRATGQIGSDLRRRPEDFSVQRIGRTLARLARTNPAGFQAFVTQLEAWGLCEAAQGQLCLVETVKREQREDADADVAVSHVLGVSRDRVSITRALRELGEQIASAKAVMVALRQSVRTDAPIEGRAVRPSRYIAAGAR